MSSEVVLLTWRWGLTKSLVTRIAQGLEIGSFRMKFRLVGGRDVDWA